LIRNAVEQGRQAMGSIADSLRRGPPRDPAMLDVVVVGCGPAGIAASLGAMEQHLRFVTIDQSTLGGTVAHFPRGKVVMTAPAVLPLVGEVRFGEVSKETLLAFWQDVLAQTGLAPQFEEQVLGVGKIDQGFEVTTDKARYTARKVLLAIGRRGSPRPLNVPGEHLSKVVYRMIDSEQYRGQRVMVVGGGDSALEAAIALAETEGTTVTLSYRGDAFARARARNRDRLTQLVDEGRIVQLLGSTPRAITPENVELDHGGELRIVPNDSVIVCAGGLLPDRFLKDAGIMVETKYGSA
jgi:thioredoxin reductase